METVCQPSYPLNSENASPPGTFTVYLSCCATAKLPKTASNTATITIAGNAVLFMAHSCAVVCKSNSTASALTAGEPCPLSHPKLSQSIGGTDGSGRIDPRAHPLVICLFADGWRPLPGTGLLPRRPQHSPRADTPPR